MGRQRLKLALALAALGGSLACAETIVVDDQVQLVPSKIDRPARGSTMHAVEAKFGAPQTRHETVGTPPITRWDYAGFSVFFEKDRVIDAVAIGA
jgi:hypothetical protein